MKQLLRPLVAVLVGLGLLLSALPAGADVATISIPFSVTAAGAAAQLSLAGQNTCAITYTSVGGGSSATVQVAADAVPTWVTATGFGASGVIANPTVNTVTSGALGSSGLTAVRLNFTSVTSGTVAGTMTCSGALGSIAISPGGSGGSTASPGYFRVQDGTTTNLATVTSGGAFSVQITNGASTIASIFSDSPAATATGNNVLGTASFMKAYNGTQNEGVRTMTAVTGSGTGVIAVGQEPQTPTYSVSSVNIVPSAAGVFFELTGAASHVIRVRSCNTSAVASAAGFSLLVARVLSSADSGGTNGAAPTIGSVDSNNAATAATAVSYTTAPTLGTVQSNVWEQDMLEISSTAATTPPQLVSMSWPNTVNAEPPTLRSASQQFVLSTTTQQSSNTFYTNCLFTDTTN